MNCVKKMLALISYCGKKKKIAKDDAEEGMKEKMFVREAAGALRLGPGRHRQLQARVRE